MKKKAENERKRISRDRKRRPVVRLGRRGVGVIGQNWAESPEAARKGRYHPRAEKEDSHEVDSDVSEAV